MRSGDVTGPMAESGFKGHPQCRFCKSRFFGDGELYIHMQSAHEQCFLCRRAHPDRFIYYKDYNELEGKSKFLPWNRALTWPPCALRCAALAPLHVDTACGAGDSAVNASGSDCINGAECSAAALQKYPFQHTCI